jgi:hypothetical protein
LADELPLLGLQEKVAVCRLNAVLTETYNTSILRVRYGDEEAKKKQNEKIEDTVILCGRKLVSELEFRQTGIICLKVL